MHSVLSKIIAQKTREVAALKQTGLYTDIASRLNNQEKSFKSALCGDALAIIGEIKRKSPSKGLINPIPDPTLLLQRYVDAGISAVSVLTDEMFFAGSIADLDSIALALNQQAIPILRKDFIIDEIQINQSLAHGANAILLIVAVLQSATETLLAYARQCHLDVIVEVHDANELAYAISIGADIIGINNRDLNTFAEDIPEAFEK